MVSRADQPRLPHVPLPGQTTLGFFPLYPIAIWVLEPLILLVFNHDQIWASTVAGAVISMIGGYVASVLVYRLAVGWWGRKRPPGDGCLPSRAASCRRKRSCRNAPPTAPGRPALAASANFYPAAAADALTTQLARLLRAAAECDLLVSISITIGNSESLEQRVKTLAMLRTLQEESNAIQAVLLRVHHAATPEARRGEEATAVDYLKTLAVTRLFLDNIEHLQTDWSVMGPKVLELALRFGAGTHQPSASPNKTRLPPPTARARYPGLSER